MDNITREKLNEIIVALETETVSLATNMDLREGPSANYLITRDLINIGSVILWLKNILRQDISKEALEQRVKTFEEVIKDHRYVTAGNISEIAFLAHRIETEHLTQKDISESIKQIIKLDENKFYTKNNRLRPDLDLDDLIRVAHKISEDASRDAAKIIQIILKDNEYMQAVRECGYRIDEGYLHQERHKESSLREQIISSENISNYLNKIMKKINTDKRM